MPAELERGTTHHVEITWPRWLGWIRRMFPVVTIRTEFPLLPEDVRELELLAEIELEEAERARPVEDLNPDGC
jgi:hypothetical protein